MYCHTLKLEAIVSMGYNGGLEARGQFFRKDNIKSVEQ